MIVADASPIIILARTGQLHLLEVLHGTVAVPAAVDLEITRHPRDYEGLRPEWISVHTAKETESVIRTGINLHHGEMEAIALAGEFGSPILIDEAQGRRVAASLGLRVVGTLATLVAARREGLIHDLSEAFQALRSEGFRVSNKIIDKILQDAGEA